MRPVTDRFLSRLREEHVIAIEARVYRPDGGWEDIPVTEGTVTLDDTTAIRGRCDITVEHTDWIPRDVTDRLAPYGGEINLRRGVFFPDGTTETVSLGWFGLEDAEITDDGAGPGARVSAMDRAERLSKAKFEDPFQLPAGTKLAEAILLLAVLAWPDCPFDPRLPTMSSMAIGKPIVAQAEDNRWEFMQDLATALGMVLYFDGDGVLTLRPYAEAGVVAELTEGENGLLLTAVRNWSRTDAFNRVIAIGESTDSDDVYRGVATDNNPLSPTFYYGPFGQCPYRYTYSEIDATDPAGQAQHVAETILAKEIGTTSTVSFGAIPNPALEPQDTVLIRRPVIGVDENHILDSLTIPLAATESMSGTTRERLVT